LLIHDDSIPDLGPTPCEQFDSSSLLWRHEQLHRLVLQDFPNRLRQYCDQRDQLENDFINRAAAVEPANFRSLSRSCFQTAQEKTYEWSDNVCTLPFQHLPNIIYRRYWKQQNRKAGIHL